MSVGRGCAEISGVSCRQVCDDKAAGEASSLRYAPCRSSSLGTSLTTLARHPCTRGFSFHAEFLPSEARCHEKKREGIISTIRTAWNRTGELVSELLPRRTIYDV
jgi:hypothetical protein